jgi:hypothetical protein
MGRIHLWILGEIISGIGKHKDVIKIGFIIQNRTQSSLMDAGRSEMWITLN